MRGIFAIVAVTAVTAATSAAVQAELASDPPFHLSANAGAASSSDPVGTYYDLRETFGGMVATDTATAKPNAKSAGMC